MSYPILFQSKTIYLYTSKLISVKVFFYKTSISHVYNFLQVVGQIKWCHVKVFLFFLFFYLVMFNPSPKPRPTSSEIGRNLFKYLKYLSMFLYPKVFLMQKMIWIKYLNSSHFSNRFKYFIYQISIYGFKDMNYSIFNVKREKIK